MATFMVNVDSEKVKTTVTDRASSVDRFITELVLSCNYSNRWPPIIGLDIEFNDLNDSTKCKPATLQLCSGSRCIIIQLVHMEVKCGGLLDLAVYCGSLEVEAKPLSVIKGNWGAGNLNMEQIESAASDAFTFFRILMASLGALLFEN
ncbi:hypothetical protein SO802_033868 [Lithocarpus litseifolius]|uniref:3'-5' exonuclease domain-containing protein n=1 Tax=Lithocarpus litseifolius TaxID=425828 RepID=A0AAW2BG00_9ROSI